MAARKEDAPPSAAVAREMKRLRQEIETGRLITVWNPESSVEALRRVLERMTGTPMLRIGPEVVAASVFQTMTAGAVKARARALGDGGGDAKEDEVLRALRSLRALDLTMSLLRAEDALALLPALRHAAVLTHLGLSLNPLGNEGAAELAAALSLEPCALVDVEVCDCNIGAAGAAALAAALRVNRTLTRFSASGNDGIGDEGGRALFEALRHNRSLAVLQICLLREHKRNLLPRSAHMEAQEGVARRRKPTAAERAARRRAKILARGDPMSVVLGVPAGEAPATEQPVEPEPQAAPPPPLPGATATAPAPTPTPARDPLKDQLRLARLRTLEGRARLLFMLVLPVLLAVYARVPGAEAAAPLVFWGGTLAVVAAFAVLRRLTAPPSPPREGPADAAVGLHPALDALLKGPLAGKAGALDRVLVYGEAARLLVADLVLFVLVYVASCAVAAFVEVDFSGSCPYLVRRAR